jgi:DNA-binding LytR/AlgR family response regulator
MESTLEDTRPLRIALCEDTVAEANLLIRQIKSTGISSLIKYFKSGEDFIAAFERGSFDLIFLDVYMDAVNGVEVAEEVRRTDSQVVIVFTTTSDDFTRDGYRLNAYKYMLKPTRQDDVTDSLELALLKRDKAQGAAIQVISDGTPLQLALNDIEYVEANNRRTSVHLVDGTVVSASATIDSLEKMLPPPRFLRSHRSYIVNLDHVVDVEEDFIMESGERAYIRVKDFRRIKHSYDDYLFNTARGGE